MPTQVSSHIQIPEDYFNFVSTAKRLEISNLVFHSLPLESVAEYANHSERIPPNFPRPEEHFVIADYLIDLPVVAANFSKTSPNYGQILAYSYSDYWIVAVSFSEFLKKLQTQRESAVWGK